MQFGSPTDAPGYTSVWARMLASDAATAERVLTELVYSVCDADPRTVDERRNDAYAALLAGVPALACACGSPECEAATRPRPHRDTTVYVITDRTTARDTATGAETETPAAPVYVFGAGLSPTPLLDELSQDARSREIIHPGNDGPQPRYTPSRELADYIRCRDLTCRFPGCDKPATLTDIDHTVPYPVGPTHPSNLKCLCRFHHLLKTFWTGADGWHDRQHPDGTVIWTSPSGHTYTTHPGSRLLFPTLCRPTATLWTGDPPRPRHVDQRGAMMPRRRNTRAHNRTRAIIAERRRNDADYGDDPPPF